MLVDKPAKEYLGHTASAIEKARAVIQLLVNDNRTAAQAALRFVIANPSITSAIVGVSRREQLNEIAGTMESDELSEEELNILRSAIPAKIYDQHK
jgi:aryl-alcohol dehydrogenase-like predicted oxidoreductase